MSTKAHTGKKKKIVYLQRLFFVYEKALRSLFFPL